MDHWQLQQALYFLTDKTKDLDLTKPVALHSMRVAEILYRVVGDEDVVIAGYCHDLIEDADVTYEEIESEFGIYVAEMVEVNTMSDEMRGDESGTGVYFEEIAAAGEGSVNVKAADLCDNLEHFRVYHDESRWDAEKRSLVGKRELFLEMCHEYKGLPLYRIIEDYSFEDHESLYSYQLTKNI